MGLTGLWLLILILSNTNTHPPSLQSLTLQHHPEPQVCPGPESELQSESWLRHFRWVEIIEEIKVILMRSKLLTFLALCQDTLPRPSSGSW